MVLIAVFLVALLTVPGSSDRLGIGSARASTTNSNAVTPPPTAYAASSFDSADNFVLMFGGKDTSGTPQSTTWSFAHSNWTDQTPAVGAPPAARWGATMADDPAAGYVVLFGGCADPGCSHVLNDTWSFAFGRWTNLTATVGLAPPARGEAMMSYDPTTPQVVLFGGRDGAGSLLGDTWTLQAGHWTQIPTPPSVPAPVARSGGAMAFDPQLNASLLFGGLASSGVLGDTWQFHGGSWNSTPAGSSGAPRARSEAGMTYDVADGYLLLTGGYNTGSYLGDLWSFGPSGWSELPDASGPLAAYAPVFVYDPPDTYVLYFSGITSQGYLTATLLYSHGQWTLLINPPGSGSSSLLFLFFPILLIAVLMPISVLAGNRTRRRREETLAKNFRLPPSEVLSWIPTPSEGNPTRRNLLVFVATVVAVIVPVTLVIGLTGGGWGVVEFVGGFVGLLMGIAFATTAWTAWRTDPRAIAITSNGLVVQRRAGDLRLPWDNLQPGLRVPLRGRYFLHFSSVETGQTFGAIPVSIPQAQAILTSPYAPPWVIPPAVAIALGVPSQRVSQPLALARPTGPVRPPEAPLRSNDPGPRGPAAPPSVARPEASTGSSTVYHARAPLAPTDPAPRPRYAPQPPPPPPPPPLEPSGFASPPIVRCPRCGLENPAGEVAFCRHCGQRLF